MLQCVCMNIQTFINRAKIHYCDFFKGMGKHYLLKLCKLNLSMLFSVAFQVIFLNSINADHLLRAGEIVHKVGIGCNCK